METFGLPEHTLKTMREVFARYPQVEKVVVYGSRTMGNYKTGSDIDLSMYGKYTDSITYQDLLHISGEFDDSDIPYLVDLSVFDDLDHVNLREHIERVGKVFYERVAMSWENVKLADISETLHQGLNTAGEKVVFVEDGFPIIQTRNISDKGINVSEKLKYLSNSDWMKYKNKYKPKIGDVFFTNIGTIGKTAIVKDEMDYLIHWNIFKIRPKSSLCTSEFLKVYLDYLTASKYFHKLQKGGTVNFVTKKMISEADIFLPSLPVQKQIVEKLDAAFADIDKAISVTQKNIKNTEALFQRILFDIFEGGNAARNTSTVSEIADHCLGKMLDKNKNKGNLQPYLRNTNVRWFSVNTDDMLLMKFEPEEKKRFSANKGDLLICEGGYPGRAAIWENENAVYFQKALHRVRCKDSIYNKWLMYYLYYLSSTNKLTRYFTGSGIQHFTGRSLKNLPVPIPSIHKTNSHVDMLDSLFEQIERVNNIYSKKISLHGKLKNSILNQAFSGELTKEAA